MKYFAILMLVVQVTGQLENNVCKTFPDYYTIKNNSNCYHNYAYNKSVGEVITLSGLPFEEHHVVTSDGFVLTVHRIPSPGKPPVFLQHGLFSNSATFITLLDKSLAFMLVNAGFDVWLGNSRGSQYSMGHMNLTKNDFEFWDHGLDELSLRDIPAVLTYIYSSTGAQNKIIYIGHSLGTTQALLFASEMPELSASLVKIFVLLGPAYTLHNIITPVKVFAPFHKAIYEIIKRFDLIRISSESDIMNGVLRTICLESPKLMELCYNGLNTLYGIRTGVKPETFPLYFGMIPTGSSIKVLRHITSNVINPLTKFDYGNDNLRIYGQHQPPHYNLQNVVVPIQILAATGDWLTSFKDALILYNSLPMQVRYGFHRIPSDNFNHMDFVIGSRSDELVNRFVITLLGNLP